MSTPLMPLAAALVWALAGPAGVGKGRPPPPATEDASGAGEAGVDAEASADEPGAEPDGEPGAEPDGLDPDGDQGSRAPGTVDAPEEPGTTPEADSATPGSGTEPKPDGQSPHEGGSKGGSAADTKGGIATDTKGGIATDTDAADDPGDDGDSGDDDEGEGADEDGDGDDKKKKDKLSFSIGGRVMAGWELDNRRPAPEQDGTPGVEHELFLQQARIKFKVDYTKRFRLRMSIELADALDSPDADRVPFLRNGYAGVRFHRSARFRFGYFKRPFSRLELRSPGDLPFRGRGLANGRIIEDRNYGDRSIGGMLWGKIPAARLQYAAGVFAPALRTPGIDVVARIRADPWAWLSVGAGGVYKRVENGTGQNVDVGGVGADLRVKWKGLVVLGDMIVARDYLVPGEPWSFGVVGYASYDVDLPKKLVLQPVVLGEWADVDLAISQNDAVRAVAGVNLIWRKRFRVMPQAQFVRPLGVIGNPWVEKDTYLVMFTLRI